MGSLKLCIALFCLLFILIEAIKIEGETRTCPKDSLPCNSGECVRREKWCDGEKNCNDKSDETYCKDSSFWSRDPNYCKKTHFLCKNGHCVPSVAQCDGLDDCKDESDEKNCEEETFEDYDDYMRSITTTAVPTKTTTTTESSSESDELGNEDFTTTTQLSHQVFTQGVPLPSSKGDFYAKRMEQESLQTGMPHSTKFSTNTPKRLPVTDRNHNQASIQNTLSTKLLSRATHPTKAYEPLISSSKPILFSTKPSFDSRRQHVPSLTSSTQPQRPYQSRYYNGHIQSSTPSYDSTRSYVGGHYLNMNYNQPQTRSTIPHDIRRESRYNPTQPSTLSASSKVDQNPHETRTSTYQHQTQSLRTHDSSRRIPPNQQQNRPTSYDTRQQPYDTRQQPYDTRQQPYDTRQQPYGTRQQPYDTRQQSYDTRQQPYDNRQQPYDNRQQPYDTRRNPVQYQTRGSGPDTFRGLPTLQVGQSQNPNDETINGATINGFRIQRIYSSDRQHFHEGYYNQNGHFITVTTNQQYTHQSPEPPRRPEPLTSSTAEPAIFDGKLKAPSRFHFAKNYTNIYGPGNSQYIEGGRDWILNIRDSNGGWGKETPRALIALSLINNSFINDTYENNIMQKQFQVFLSTSLIRGEANTTSINRLAISVNALIATCQNPRDFHGTDFTELIRNRLREQNRENRERRIRNVSVNPFVYLSLCLADRNLDHLEVHDLMTRLHSHDSTDEFEQDKQTMAISAFNCHLQLQKSRNSSSSEYQRDMDTLLNNATSKLLERMREDGSFGSVYSTALAAQVLMSLNNTKNWNPELTFDFLKKHQKDDGSFGDFLATYLVLPALSGRSLLHLRNTQCTPPNSDRALTPTEILVYRGPKHYVRYSLYIGYPKTNGYSIEVLVPIGISFFDIMRVAAHKNEAFKFSYEERNGEIYVYSISNVPNDSERGLEWNLFARIRSSFEVEKPNIQERILGDIRKFYPRSDQHVIFWYKPSDTWT